MSERASATKFTIPLMCWMSVVNCKIQLSCRSVRGEQECEWVNRAKVKSLCSIRTENCVASKMWQKCLTVRYTVSNSRSKALYLRSVGFRVLEKKANGRQSPSMNW